MQSCWNAIKNPWKQNAYGNIRIGKISVNLLIYSGSERHFGEINYFEKYDEWFNIGISDCFFSVFDALLKFFVLKDAFLKYFDVKDA